MARRRQINDCQTTMAKTNIAFNPMPFSIRTAMSNRVRHALQHYRRYRVVI
ncbi:hypothetical protein PS676_04416 [Pseudomonas fluorescens]|nr:hypothetical protein PS676_04416 [Pseudomonas fluorescens]